MNGAEGKLSFPKMLDAQIKAFDVVESGKAGAYLARCSSRS
jgi:hypothetical protein